MMPAPAQAFGQAAGTPTYASVAGSFGAPQVNSAHPAARAVVFTRPCRPSLSQSRCVHPRAALMGSATPSSAGGCRCSAPCDELQLRRVATRSHVRSVSSLATSRCSNAAWTSTAATPSSAAGVVQRAGVQQSGEAAWHFLQFLRRRHQHRRWPGRVRRRRQRYVRPRQLRLQLWAKTGASRAQPSRQRAAQYGLCVRQAQQ